MKPGDLLANRYRVVGELGRGGMGVVLQVIDTFAGNAVVALKTLRVEHGSNPGLQLRLKEEFRNKASLRHPNMVGVLDYGRLDQRTCFLTMEYVAGDTLRDLLGRGALSLQLAGGYLVQLLQALRFLHSRLFVHRDVKPENIRITPEGTLKLMDFGMMHQLGVRSRQRVEGTPGYIAPEVVCGGIIDAGTDLYSAGCVAFEMLAGHLPFAGDPSLALHACTRRTAPPLRALRPDVPVILDEVVHRMLEPDQQHRYRSAADALGDLAAALGISVGSDDREEKNSYLTTSMLVGRERELATLESALADARNGSGRAIFIGAPAGKGKSRLAQELALQAKVGGVLVLQAQCHEDTMAPFQAMAQALATLVPTTPQDELERLRPRLARLLPGSRPDGARATAGGEGPAAREQLHAAVGEWLRGAAARQPLLLLLDDLQWCDPQSLSLLVACIRDLTDARVLFLTTFRDDETPRDSAVWSMLAQGPAQHMRLRGLGPADVTRLLHAMLPGMSGGERLAQLLWEATEGNAFFVTESLRCLIEEGAITFSEGSWRCPPELDQIVLPSSVAAALQRRLQHLPPAARRVADVAAVVGQRQAPEVLLELSGLADEELLGAVRELVERQLLLEDEGQCVFTHGRVREAVYAQLLATERRELHQRCAEILERSTDVTHPEHTTALAHHYGRGRDARKAYHYAARAGDEALASGQESTAIMWWQQASAELDGLELPDKEARQFELWWRIGTTGVLMFPGLVAGAMERCVQLLESQGNVTRIAALLRRIVALASWLPRGWRARLRRGRKLRPYRHRVRRGWRRWLPPLQLGAWLGTLVQAHVLQCLTAGYAGDPRRGIRSGERALALLPARGTALEGIITVAIAGCYYSAGWFDGALDLIETALPLLENGQHELVPVARVGAGFIASSITFQGRRFDQALIDRSVEEAWAIGGHNLICGGWASQALWYAITGRYRESIEKLDAMGSLCRRIGAPPYQLAIYVRALLHVQRGEWEAALAQVQRGDRPVLGERLIVRMVIDVLHGTVLGRLGRAEAGERMIRGVLLRARQQGIDAVVLAALIALGEHALLRRELDGAQSLLEQARAGAAAGRARNPYQQAVAARLLAELAMARGASGGLALANELLGEAFDIVSPPEQDNIIECGRLHRTRGDWHALQGQLAAAAREYDAAAELFRSIENRYEERLTEIRRAEVCPAPVPEPAAPPPALAPGGTLDATRDSAPPESEV